ncbi:MAG: hypothetical protein QOF84_7581 [Streptomyces sp.]|jgi:uncharacterized protein YndB with AHSA1/START domain|nr:hypothetical protein [Streptomyces sp.]MDX6352791.1 hypothetical protein [Streptomyces sp.]
MAQQTVTTTDNDFTITRTFPAPLATVWATWTAPAHFQQWFHAKPGSVELEVRAGAPWKAVLETPAGEMPMSGVYREVVEGQKIVWTIETPDEPVVMTATFSERDGRTLATYHQNLVGPYSCDQAVAGATQILDSFEQHLGTVS